MWQRVTIGVLLAASVAANAAALVVAARRWSEIRPAIARVVKPWLRPVRAEDEAALEGVVSLVKAQGFASEKERNVFVRDFVHRNSLHRIDEEHDRYAFDTPRVIGKLWATHRTGRSRPHLSCGPRALAMRAILEALGVPARLVMVFSDNHPRVVSHTFVEVFNRETRRWTAHDPDFNVHYKNLDTQERASTLELVWGDPDRFLPRSPSADGWHENRLTALRRDYFEAMIQLHHLDGGRSVVVVNTDRFDPWRRFPESGNASFYEFARHHYANPAFITNHGFPVSQ